MPTSTCPEQPLSPETRQSILEQLERLSQEQSGHQASDLDGSRGSDPHTHGRWRGPQRRGLRWQDRTLLILACVLAALLLLRMETASAQEDPVWGLSLQSGQQNTLQLAMDTAVHAEVTGLLARVHVVQSFQNHSSDWAEGTYRFPLPDGAAVDRLYVQVGDRVLEGEIQEREDARRVYQQAREAGQVASLVRQERANQFHTSLANIGPGETIRVMISFLLKVDYRDGAFRLRLPNTFTPRFGSEPQLHDGLAAPHPQLTASPAALSPAVGATPMNTSTTASTTTGTGTPAKPGPGFSLQVDLAAGFPISAVESLHHDVDIQSVDSGYEISLLDPTALADRDFELRWMPEFGAAPASALSTWSDGEHVYAQLMLIPPQNDALLPQPREVIFVIDTSGSMEGASIEQARAALVEGLGALGTGDRFNLIQFNSITEPLFESARPVTENNLDMARRWIDTLNANGGTDMAPALREALKPADSTPMAFTGLLRQVVFVTDGSVGNERELLLEIADQLQTSRLFTVAIGSAPNSWFMRKAAEIGRGHHTHIGRQEDVADTMAALWTHIRLPAVSDLCIDWGLEAEYYPEILPDLYAGQPIWVVARMTEAPGLVGLCGELNGQSWVHDAWPETLGGNDTLATLWARSKIESLNDSVMFGADPAQMRAEVTQLALEHQLLTPFTSLVAVAQTPSRPAAAPLGHAAVPSLLPAGSTAGAAFPATATGWKTQLFLSLLVLGISGGLFLKPYFRLPVLRRRRAVLAARP